MPKAPGENRPADVTSAPFKVMRIATGEETEKVGTTKSAAELGSRGGISFLLTEEFPRNMGLIFNRCRRARAGAGSLPLICPYADWRGRPCGAAVVVFASLPWSPLIPARRLLDSLVIVGRRFSDGDRRRATRIIIVSVGPVRIRPSFEAVLLAGPQRNVHDPRVLCRRRWR
jgi:hypothetical protein